MENQVQFRQLEQLLETLADVPSNLEWFDVPQEDKHEAYGVFLSTKEGRSWKEEIFAGEGKLSYFLDLQNHLVDMSINGPNIPEAKDIVNTLYDMYDDYLYNHFNSNLFPWAQHEVGVDLCA